MSPLLYTKKLSRLYLLLMGTALMIGCSTDPAVRLANCVERDVAALKRSGNPDMECECDIGLTGLYAAVIYPAHLLTNSDLKSQGMSEALVKEVRELQFAGEPYESIFVIPLEGQRPPSRTTYYHNFATVKNLSFITRNNSVVRYILNRDNGITFLYSLR